MFGTSERKGALARIAGMRLEIRSHVPRIWLACAMTAFAGAAAAQAPAAEGTPGPSLPTQLQYTSAIGTYQAYEDQPVQSWREANDRVGRIGGWRAYAKEARAAKPAGPASSPLSSDPHASHHGGGKP